MPRLRVLLVTVALVSCGCETQDAGGDGGGGVDLAGVDFAGSGGPWDPRERSTDPELPRMQVPIPVVPAGVPCAQVANETQFLAALTSCPQGSKIEVTGDITLSDVATMPNRGNEESYTTIYGTGWDTNPPVAFGENTGQVAHVTPATPMPVIKTKGISGAITFAVKAHHYHFVGLEFSYDASVTSSAGLFRMTAEYEPAANQPHHIIVDRCRVRGNGNLIGVSHRRGISMNANWTAVHQSYIDGFLEKGTDAQAIAGWSSTGPHRITNNFVEGATENIMFGGSNNVFSDPPADIEIRFNHIYKRNAWLRSGETKNLFELKFAHRVLVESNILENYRIDQQRAAVNLKSAYNEGNTAETETAHVTFRYNVFKKIDARLFNLASFDGNASSSIIPLHDVLLWHNLVTGALSTAASMTTDDLKDDFLFVGNEPQYPMSNLSIRHNSGLGSAKFSIEGNDMGGGVSKFEFLDNICSGEISTRDVARGIASLDKLAPNQWSCKGNIFHALSNTQIPAQNYLMTAIGDIGLQNWDANGNSNLRLKSSSSYKGKASDGTDPGCNVDLVEARIQGVAYTPAIP